MFLAKRAIDFMMSDASKIKFDSRDDAQAAFRDLLKNKMIVQVEKQSAKQLAAHSDSFSLNEDGYYVWIFQAASLKMRIYAVLVLIGTLTAVMFPLWPESMRVGVWYISMLALGLIGLLLAISLVRLVLFGITSVILRPGLWWFPNLYADVGFVESFIPFWGWEGQDYLPESSGEKRAMRKKQRKAERKAKRSSPTDEQEEEEDDAKHNSVDQEDDDEE